MRKSVSTKGDISARKRLRAACVLETLESRVLLAADLKFAVIGDYSSDISTKPESDVSNLVKSWNPAFVVTAGDNNYPNGAASTIDANIGQFYHQYISPYTGTYGAGSSDGQNHFFPSLGNHDWDSGDQPYLNYFTLPGNERYYDYTQGNTEIFVLDSDTHEPDGTASNSIQAQWLQSELAKSTAQWKLVFFHHAPYSSGPSGGSAWMRWPFQSWGATAVIGGHDHTYERLSENGFPYFVNGLGGESIFGFNTIDGGSQVRYENDYGAMLLDAGSTSLTFQFITRTGQVIDTYTIGTASAPAAPSNLTASAVSANQINLTWKSNSTNQTGFKIERSTDGVNYTVITTAAATATSYSDTTLSGGLTYFYRVRATNSGGDSTASNVASATTLSGIPLITAGSTWKYLDNGTNQNTAWRATTFSDTAWKSGKAQLGYGDGDEATIVSYGTSSTKKYITTYFRQAFTVSNPAAITALNLQLLRDDGAVVYLNGTEVFRSNMPTGAISNTTLASTTIDGAGESTWNPATINPTLLVAGTNVIAVEIHQAAATSSDISFDFSLTGSGVPSAPAAPTNLTAVAITTSQVVLGWTDNATNESGFKVERSADNITFTQIGTTTANISSYNDSTASGGLTYYYRVRATNAAGDSGYSDIATAPPLTPPIAPTNLTAVATPSNSVNLAWTDNSNNEAGFELNRSTDGTTWALVINGEDDVPSYTDSGLAPGATYYYRVRAINAAGNSPWSNTATVTLAATSQIVYLSDLTWASATNGWGPVEKDMSNGGQNAGDGHPLTLNGVIYTKGLGVNSISTIIYNLGGAYATFQTDMGVDDEEGVNGSVDFQIYADGVLMFDSDIMTASSPTFSYSLSVAGVQQLKLVCGDAGDGASFDHGDWAGAQLTLSSTPVVPLAPSGLTATAVSTTQVNLIWTDNSINESGFKVERSTDGVNYSVIGTTGANVTTFSDTTGKASTQYSYRIRSTNSAGDSAPSNVATATTLANTVTTTYLSDLTWVSATNAWGPVEKNMSNGGQAAGDGHTITLNGVTYSKGLGVNAISQIVYNLGGAYTSFLSDIGVDDEETKYGTVDFQVIADGVKIYDSGTMTATSATKSINVSVAGVQQLTLICTDAGDGPDYDHGDWAGARLTSTAPAGAAVPLFNTTTQITTTPTTTTPNDLTADQTGRKTT